ncbi:MAG: alpha-glucan family phosphorylase [Dehalococcoidia bacterium]|nr:alpha-glucan family phosphorylase [Dehalococcoidia bacterium]
MRLRATRTFLVEPALPAAIEPLKHLAHNLYWSWDTDAVALFERLGRDRWEDAGHNPVRLLQMTPRSELERLARDDGFVTHLDRVNRAFTAYMARTPQKTVPGTSDEEVIAYFSLEFALTESLPVYSGGLGVLAGDHLKSASDLGLPLVGVGLLYREGYFQQALGPDGWQNEEYAAIDLASQPLQRQHGADGEPLVIPVPFDGRNVSVAVWRIDVGQTPLYLLDTDIDQNSPGDRKIGSRLYGGDIETRIQQEMLLGIGGVRALHALNLHPAVCHMNEGHSALLGVERIRMLMEQTGLSFAEAMLPVSSATVFTTHTAVAAGIDLFPPDLVRRHLSHYYNAMGLGDRDFLGLGRMNPDDDMEPFSMALLGLRLSGYRNGVSKLHRTVSRRLWEAAWPRLPLEQVPIDSVTNGVHLPTWVGSEVGDLYDRYIGREWRDDPVRPQEWKRVHEVPDEELWSAKVRQRHQLVSRARMQHRESAARRGFGGADPEFGEALDPNALTIGFARRFAGYKRATLLFRDPDRLARIIGNPERPIQFIFAGKAHPRDEPAKQLIREVVTYSRRPEFRDRLVVLERYDVELARALVQGCDVWLNTPLRPLEASGTSGMKAVANGGLHLSVLDGWWHEAFQPGLGWQVGRDRIDDDPEMQDAFDTESLYDLLENDVAPLFYERDPDGLPRRWLARMKASVGTFAPLFTTHRMVGEYADTAYAPAAHSWGALRAGEGAAARELAAWLARVREHWHEIKVYAVEDDGSETSALAQEVNVTVQLHLGQLLPPDVHIDLVYGETSPSGDFQGDSIAPMTYESMGEDGICRYRATIAPETSGRVGYVVRVLPAHANLHNALDLNLVYWA